MRQVYDLMNAVQKPRGYGKPFRSIGPRHERTATQSGIVMRILVPFLSLWVCVSTAMADPEVDRLIDAMGMPDLIRAFSAEGEAASVMRWMRNS